MVAPGLGGLHSTVQDGGRRGTWWGCEDCSHQRGLSHCVEVTPQKTCRPLQWTPRPPRPQPPHTPRREESPRGFFAITPELLHVQQQDSEGSGSIKSSLCLASRGLTSFSVFMGKSFQAANSSHSPSMSQLDKGGISVADSASGITESPTFSCLIAAGTTFCASRSHFSISLQDPVFPSELPAAASLAFSRCVCYHQHNQSDC